MPTKKNFPYQPLLLRILHNLQGLWVLMAIITAIWTYNTYDGRWGKLPIPDWQEVEGIHGTFGLWSLLMLPIFVIYIFHRQKQKIIQSNTFNQLSLINKPIWWYSLHRLINTFNIFALTFAVFSGKMMDEQWLPDGELDHLWYYLHLMSLIIMVVSISLHILMSLKIGGYPLILSMMKYEFREKDHPYLWINNCRYFFSNWLVIIKRESMILPSFLFKLESTILIIIFTAWLISLIK